MFPLGTVLFPSVVLPLHVFEARYRALVRTCLDRRPRIRCGPDRTRQRGRRAGRSYRCRDGGPHRRGTRATRRPVGARRRRGAKDPGAYVVAGRPPSARRCRRLAGRGAGRRPVGGIRGPPDAAAYACWPSRPSSASRPRRWRSNWPTTRCWVRISSAPWPRSAPPISRPSCRRTRSSTVSSWSAGCWPTRPSSSRRRLALG